MNYEKIYSDFIEDRHAKESALISSGDYKERHHILPRSLGGSDDADNLIYLTARDHYFAHCCLAKIYGGKMWSALFAVAAMTKVDKASAYFLRGPMVAIAREKAAAVRSTHMTHLWKTGEFTRNRVYGPMPDEVKEKIRQSSLGKRWSKERRLRASRLRQKHCKQYDFVHADTGETFSGSQSAFSRHTGIDQSLASALTRGRIITAKGWSLKGVDVRGARNRDATVRVFVHKSGQSFTGTMYEFRTAFNLDSGVISNLVKGKNGVKTFKGWKYVGTEKRYGESG